VDLLKDHQVEAMEERQEEEALALTMVVGAVVVLV